MVSSSRFEVVPRHNARAAQTLLIFLACLTRENCTNAPTLAWQKLSQNKHVLFVQACEGSAYIEVNWSTVCTHVARNKGLLKLLTSIEIVVVAERLTGR